MPLPPFLPPPLPPLPEPPAPRVLDPGPRIEFYAGIVAIALLLFSLLMLLSGCAALSRTESVPPATSPATPSEVAQVSAQMASEAMQRNLVAGKVKFKGPVYVVPGNNNTVADQRDADLRGQAGGYKPTEKTRTDASTTNGIQSWHVVVGGVVVALFVCLLWYLRRPRPG